MHTHKVSDSILQMLAERGEVKKEFIPTQSLHELGILSPGEISTSQQLIFESRGGEGWIYAYSIAIGNSTSTREVRVKEKNMITFAMKPQDKAEDHLERVRLLQTNGVPTPHTWGAKRGALYQEFIDDKTNEAIRVIQQGDSSFALPLIRQLTSIGARLDTMGFQPSDMVRELIFDGNMQRFMVLDVGFDLGGPGKSPSSTCINQLLKRFPKYEDYIYRSYNMVRNNSQHLPQAV